MADLLEPILHMTIGDAIVEQLKDLIIQGELRPGDRLPPEIDLAKKLGVSRPSVREALRALTALGLIERSHEGTFVRPDEHKLFVEPFSYLVTLKKITFSELFETRRALETELAGLAAERADADDIQKMRLALERMANHADESDVFVASNVAFHMAVAEAAKNRVLCQMWHAVRGEIVQTQLQGACLSEVVQQSIGDHERILKAIQQRNRTKAIRAMTRHLNNVQKGVAHRVVSEIEIRPDKKFSE